MDGFPTLTSADYEGAPGVKKIYISGIGVPGFRADEDALIAQLQRAGHQVVHNHSYIDLEEDQAARADMVALGGPDAWMRQKIAEADVFVMLQPSYPDHFALSLFMGSNHFGGDGKIAYVRNIGSGISNWLAKQPEVIRVESIDEIAANLGEFSDRPGGWTELFPAPDAATA
jgi:hypothetical protein